MTTIADLKFDPQNARRHNERNMRILMESLQEVGAARSIVIDENNVILAGNGLVEAAGQVGIENVQIVEVDGETITAVRVTGLSPEAKKRLALYDNRSSDFGEYDPDILASLNMEGLLDGLWYENEAAIATGKLELPDDPRELWGNTVDMGTEANASRQLTIYFKESEHVEAFAALLDQAIDDNTKSLWYPAETKPSRAKREPIPSM